jgi:hypothetical protein
VLRPGTLVGHYEILEPLGAGGMGEAYRARDEKLGRDVAIKVLPDGLAADSRRLARFQREAMLLASLNHPHIAQIHGVDESGARPALIMEMVEGEDLAHRLARRPLAIDDAIRLAIQIAQALEAAHEIGIVHRDLKPANIKVRPDGVVKVLDFGLAKGPEHAPAPVPALSTATLSAVSQPGAVIGTAAYMSPEQAKGATVDRRTDIWAFGCVLFEMLTGRMCFHGDSTAETIVRVLDREPEWERLPPSTPDHVRRVLGRCLQKDVNRRLRDLGDARLDLEDTAVTPWNRQQPPVAVSRRGWWLTLFAAGLVAAIVAGLWRAAGPSPIPPRETRVTRLTDLPGLEETPALSPDGKALAFTGSINSQRQILVQLLAGGAPLRLTQDAADHESPRWTADSSSIIYFSPAAPGSAQGALWEISALGGSPRRISDSLGGADVSTANGRLAFFRLANGSIALVSATPDGASVVPVAEFPPSSYYLNPRWSPDGRWIAFERGDSIRFDVFAVPGGGGAVRQVTRENNMINGFAWLPDSTGIVYSSSRASTMPYLATSSLWSARLDDGAVRQLSSGDFSHVISGSSPSKGRRRRMSRAVCASRGRRARS